jgi:N-acetylneuraminic acid mutarotase
VTSDALLQYDPATQMTEARAPLPEGRDLAGAATHNGIIYVFGGMAYGFAQDSTFAYDTATDTWTAVAPMSAPLAGANAVTVDDMIYVDGANGLSRYDPMLDLWTGEL